MRSSFKSAVAGVLTLCVAGVISAAGATSASAAVSPFDPDPNPNAYGTLTFYDAAGNVVTSGTNAAESPKFAVASTNPTSTVLNKRAGLFLFNPQAGQPTGNWNGTQMNTNTVYPLLPTLTTPPTTIPAVVGSSTFPATMQLPTSQSFAAIAATFVPNTGALANLFQVRLKNVQLPDYASATISIDPATGAWQQVFPVPAAVVTSTTTALTVSPASPAVAPANLTLTATVSPTAAGTMQFLNGTTSLGNSPVTAGVATLAVPGVVAGSYSLTAKFTPTDPTAFGPSTSAAVPYLVNAPKPTPTVGLTSSSAAPTLGDPVTFTATVTSPNIPGTVEFLDGTTSLAAAATTSAAGVATLTTSTLTAGTHSVTAKFVPTDLVTNNGATSPAVLVNVLTGACSQTGSKCTDAQGFKVVVPVGSLVISTPYTAASPFDLGTMALNSAATELSTGPKAFGAGGDGNGVTITDQRSGDLPWTASLQSSAFTSGANAINARNLGFTGVAPQYQSGNALSPAKPVVPTQNPAITPAVGPADTSVTTFGLDTSRTFAAAAHGAGSVFVTGNFTLNAPTSTPAGAYLGTVTFTIS